MARTVRLDSLRLQAQQRADMENATFIGTAEWNAMINASATELYDLLTTVFEDYYFQTTTVLTTGTDTYALPATFYKLLGVDQVLSSTQHVTCKPFVFAERNSYTRYSGSGETLSIPYIPTMTALTADADTFDGINGWEEYIVIDVAIKALTKEESDVSTLLAAKAAILKRINDCAPNRDAGMPDRVTDIYRVDPFNDLFLTSRIRYRILGNNLQLVTYQTAMGMP